MQGRPDFKAFWHRFLQNTEMIDKKTPTFLEGGLASSGFGQLNIDIWTFPSVDLKSVSSVSSDAAGGGCQNAQASWDQCRARVLWGLQQKAVWYLQILPEGKSRRLFLIVELLSDQGSNPSPYAVFCYKLTSYQDGCEK